METKQSKVKTGGLCGEVKMSGIPSIYDGKIYVLEKAFKIMAMGVNYGVPPRVCGDNWSHQRQGREEEGGRGTEMQQCL